MLNKKNFIIILIFIPFFIFPNNIFFYNRDFSVDCFSTISFQNNRIKFFEDNPNGYKIIFEGKYVLTEKEDYTLLTVKDKSFVVFYLNESIILCDIKTGKFIYGTDYSNGGLMISSEQHLFYIRNIKSNSFLTEGKIKYPPENLN
ncbi:MAG: hypothetical protein JXB50_15745 [Spirochaetes bacterium]|nr:hypothetical protein [Spirochaetota bacterium]